MNEVKKRSRFHEKDIFVLCVCARSLAWRLGYLFACLPACLLACSLDCCWYTTLSGLCVLYITNRRAKNVALLLSNKQTERNNNNNQKPRRRKKCTTVKYVSLPLSAQPLHYSMSLHYRFGNGFSYAFFLRLLLHPFWFRFFASAWLQQNWYIRSLLLLQLSFSFNQTSYWCFMGDTTANWTTPK